MHSSRASTESVFGATIAASARAIAEDATLSISEDSATAAASLGVARPAHSALTHNAASRGYSDIIAHVAAHHSKRLHKELQPSDVLAARLFNEFERARCEAIGSERYIGSAANLAALWTDQHKLQSATGSQAGEHQFLAIVTVVRECLGLIVPPNTPDKSDQNFKQGNSTRLQQLGAAIYHQRRFAELSLSIIQSIELSAANAPEETVTRPSDDNEEESREQETDSVSDDEEAEDTEDSLTVTLREEQDNGSGDLTHTDASPEDTPDITANRDAPVSTESDSAGGEATESAAGYRVYSRSEDEIVRATELCTAEELVLLRDTLDQHIHRHARIIGKLSGRLQRVLMAEQTRQWQFNLAEGILDTARLTRVVTNPMSPLSFKQEMDSPFKDTSITLLVDNSRSMLGKPIAIAAACADLLSQTLERCGVSVEILGFTTTELHRGPLHESWTAAGANPQPGRLNGLRHIIYKPADTPYRRSRMNFGVMLKKDLLKQNIDGESLLWAYQRLLQRNENRKVLIVISDGAPIDTSTMAVNRENFLVDHLQQVISQIERADQAELLAIGIGHDVTRYYQNAMKIMNVKDLSQSLLAHMSELFSNTK